MIARSLPSPIEYMGTLLLAEGAYIPTGFQAAKRVRLGPENG
jgi:hypothetical protein